MICTASITKTKAFKLSGNRNAMARVPIIAPKYNNVKIHLVFLNISFICVLGVAKKHDLYYIYSTL